MAALNGTYRILVEHMRAPDDELDYHEWWMPGDVVWRDSLGRTRVRSFGSRCWHVARCNNSDCPAEAIIQEAAILDLLPRADGAL